MKGAGEDSNERNLAATHLPSVTVYLPRSLRRRINSKPDSILLYGWTYTASPAGEKIIIVVAGSTTLQEARRQSLQAVNSECEGSVSLIGECRRCEDVGLHTSKELDHFKRQSLTWLEICTLKDTTSACRTDQRAPTIDLVKMPSNVGACDKCAVNVILYTIPQSERMKYYNLERIVLPSASSAGVLDQQSLFDGGESMTGTSELRHKLRDLINLDPLRFSELQHSFGPGLAPGEGFRKAIGLINQCSYINDAISRATKATANGHHYGSSKHVYTVDALWQVMRFVKSCCHLDRAPLRKSIMGFALIDISATALQLDLRLGQLMVWPKLAYSIRKQRRKDQEPVSNLAPRYIALYNGIWLVMNDLILGQAVGIAICDNSDLLARTISRWISLFLLDDLVIILDWLDNWPAGVKLNLQLSRFFRDLYANLTHICGHYIHSILVSGHSTTLSNTLYAFGILTRLFGLTMAISIAIDLIRLLTLHCTVFYRLQQTIFRFFCTTIVSLFQLFRGKKRNPLRGNRIDQATYELDQLLLGTIFFTLLVFLWLTVAVYYLYFGLLRLGIVGSIAMLQTALAFLNHLPLFALMLRIKEPDRLPAGVELQPLQVSQASNPLQCCYYELHNVPLEVSGIFRGYNNHLQALRQMPVLLWNLLIGRPL